MRRPVALGHSGHVGHCGRRRAEAEADEASGHHCRVVGSFIPLAARPRSDGLRKPPADPPTRIQTGKVASCLI